MLQALYHVPKSVILCVRNWCKKHMLASRISVFDFSDFSVSVLYFTSMRDNEG